MSRFDAFMALILGVSISLLDSLILSGPYLGVLGFLLSFFLGALGWFAGTAVVHRIGARIDRRRKDYRGALWILSLLTSVLIAIAIIPYSVLFLVGNINFSPGEIVLHVFVLFATATAVRTMLYAAKMASNAERRTAPQSSKSDGSSSQSDVRKQ